MTLLEQMAIFKTTLARTSLDAEDQQILYDMAGLMTERARYEGTLEGVERTGVVVNRAIEDFFKKGPSDDKKES